MNRLFTVSALLALSLPACNAPAAPSNPNPTPPAPPVSGAYTMSGVVRSSNGTPIAGAQVFAGHTVYHNTNALTTSGADGRYSVSVREPAGSWYAGGQLKRTYDGREYTFDLLPDNTAPFTGASGAVRNFTWKLTGDRPNGGKYGATVTVYADFFDPELLDWIDDIELTLTPSGPIIDGSVGSVVRGKIKQTPDGQEGLVDIALGKYAITARYAPQDAPARDLKIRVRNTGSFGPSVTSTFKQLGSGHILEVEVSRQ